MGISYVVKNVGQDVNIAPPIRPSYGNYAKQFGGTMPISTYIVAKVPSTLFIICAFPIFA